MDDPMLTYYLKKRRCHTVRLTMVVSFISGGGRVDNVKIDELLDEIRALDDKIDARREWLANNQP